VNLTRSGLASTNVMSSALSAVHFGLNRVLGRQSYALHVAELP